jgi:concanavalin A-like lectin/glucanase superfamily protein
MGLWPSAACIEDLPDPVVIEGLIGYWSFDEGSGLTARDVSGHDRIGNLVLGASWTADGRVGSALHVDGTGARVEASIPGFGTSSFSASTWVRSTMPAPQARVVGAVFEAGYAFLDFGDAPFEAVDSAGGYWDLFGELPPIDDGAWHHLGFVVDRDVSKRARLFIDGALALQDNAENPSTGSFGDPAASYVFLIGAQNPNLAVTGDIDEVRLYGRALSDAEMAILGERP